MVGLSFLVWVAPVVIAGVIGWRSAKTPPETRGAALRAIGRVLAWSAAAIYLFHLAWLGLSVPSGGLDFWPPFVWMFLTAMFWIPVAVIAFILRAQREMRE